MKLAINQPYFFPYIGYFQLLNQVDIFVSLDDVNYIKKGWISRNTIADSQGLEIPFSVPLSKPSQNKDINQTLLSSTYPDWRAKWLITLQHCYGKTSFYRPISQLINDVVHDHTVTTIADLAEKSIVETCKYLGIRCAFGRANKVTKTCNGEARILEICKAHSATQYFNLSGGVTLYHSDKFIAQGIDLFFLRSLAQPYRDIPNTLSVIDIMMHNDPKDIRDMLTQTEIWKG